MNKLLIKKLLVGASMAAIMLPFAALAQADVYEPLNESTLGIEYGAATGLTTTDVRTTVSKIINAFMGLLGIVAVVLIMLGGFKWMMAGGATEKVEEAKKLMTQGVIGLVIVMTSYAISRFVIGALVNATK